MEKEYPEVWGLNTEPEGTYSTIGMKREARALALRWENQAKALRWENQAKALRW